jgi:hypothetical protein
VSHTLAADRLLGYLDTTAITNDAFVADTLVLTTMTFPVLDRTENLLAEEALLLRLEGAVVDRFRLQNLAIRALKNGLGGSQADGDAAEVLLDLLGFSVGHVGIRRLGCVGMAAGGISLD